MPTPKKHPCRGCGLPTLFDWCASCVERGLAPMAPATNRARRATKPPAEATMAASCGTTSTVVEPQETSAPVVPAEPVLEQKRPRRAARSTPKLVAGRRRRHLCAEPGADCDVARPSAPMTWCDGCWAVARRRAAASVSASDRLSVWESILAAMPGEFRRNDWLRIRLPDRLLGMLALIGAVQKHGSDPVMAHAYWKGFGLTREHLARLYASGLWAADGGMTGEWIFRYRDDSTGLVSLALDAEVVEGRLERFWRDGEWRYQKPGTTAAGAATPSDPLAPGLIGAPGQDTEATGVFSSGAKTAPGPN